MIHLYISNNTTKSGAPLDPSWGPPGGHGPQFELHCPKGFSFADSMPDLMVESRSEDFQFDVCCYIRAMRNYGVTREKPHACPNSPGSVSRNVSHPSIYS